MSSVSSAEGFMEIKSAWRVFSHTSRYTSAQSVCWSLSVGYMVSLMAAVGQCTDWEPEAFRGQVHYRLIPCGIGSPDLDPRCKTKACCFSVSSFGKIDSERFGNGKGSCIHLLCTWANVFYKCVMDDLSMTVLHRCTSDILCRLWISFLFSLKISCVLFWQHRFHTTLRTTQPFIRISFIAFMVNSNSLISKSPPIHRETPHHKATAGNVEKGCTILSQEYLTNFLFINWKLLCC